MPSSVTTKDDMKVQGHLHVCLSHFRAIKGTAPLKCLWKHPLPQAGCEVADTYLQRLACLLGAPVQALLLYAMGFTGN